MCVKPKQLKNIHVPCVFLNGCKLELVTRYKYLGHIMCDDNKDDDAVASQIRGLYSRGNTLIKHFKYCSEDIKSLLFKTYCSSFYCCHLWSNCSADSRNRMKVAHNRIFRVLMNLEHRVSMSHNFILYNVHHSNVIARNSINGFMDRICMSSNSLLVTILESNFYNDCLMLKHWCNTIYTNT